ncbi:MAG TPA: alpha/beta fold hydrolase [Polyangia bacterium]|jgi:carboxylesterase|nr:alpha/beta fold hydrolase [Polyangia bacterium]
MFGFQTGNGDKTPISTIGDKRGVLCLHGMTGTPFEVRSVGEALVGGGYSVEVPLLAGHGATLRDLAATQWPDWLASAERAMEQLRRNVGDRPIAIVGFSMGGLLALRLAHLYPERIAALVIIAAPLRMRPFQTRGVRALCRLPVDFKSYPFVCIPKLKGSDISDVEMRDANPSLRAFPISAVTSLFDLMDQVRPDLPNVRVPTLVIHGRQDHTVPMEDSLELTGSLGSEVIERLWLERSFHIVTLDVERSTVSSAIASFLARHLGDGDAEAGRMGPP